MLSVSINFNKSKSKHASKSLYASNLKYKMYLVTDDEYRNTRKL